MFTAMTDAAPSTNAVITFIEMYAAGDSGVSRSCLLQPWARSIDTIAPPNVVAATAPYSSRLIMTSAEVLPCGASGPAGSTMRRRC